MRHVNKEGQVLYAIACNHYVVKERCFKPHTYYMHAASQGDARLQFCRAYPNRRTHQIVAIGAALGFFYKGKDKSREVTRDVASAD